jgi:alpha-1,3-glucan synthase
LQATDHLLLRKGAAKNAMVFPDSDYDKDAFTESGDSYVFNHSAFGADMFRYTPDFGKTWTDWKNWEDQTTIPKSLFTSSQIFWGGQHIIVQCGWFLVCMLGTPIDICD